MALGQQQNLFVVLAFVGAFRAYAGASEIRSFLDFRDVETRDVATFDKNDYSLTSPWASDYPLTSPMAYAQSCNEDKECDQDVNYPFCTNGTCQTSYPITDPLNERPGFNSSAGECVCACTIVGCRRDTDCERKPIGDKHYSVSECFNDCLKDDKCAGFQVNWLRSAHVCQMYSTRHSLDPRIDFARLPIGGNGKPLSYCYSKPASKSLCLENKDCASLAGPFCCPSPTGMRLDCCDGLPIMSVTMMWLTIAALALCIMILVGILFASLRPHIHDPVAIDIGLRDNFNREPFDKGKLFNSDKDFIVMLGNSGSGDGSVQQLFMTFKILISNSQVGFEGTYYEKSPETRSCPFSCCRRRAAPSTIIATVKGKDQGEWETRDTKDDTVKENGTWCTDTEANTIKITTAGGQVKGKLDKGVITFVGGADGTWNGKKWLCKDTENTVGMCANLTNTEERDKAFQKIKEMMDKKKQDRNEKTVKVFACGGDGTVTWVLKLLYDESETFATKYYDTLLDEDFTLVDGKKILTDRGATKLAKIPRPAVGIVPLGTGNDLARSLGWGSALLDINHFYDYIKMMTDEKSEEIKLDQWQLVVTPRSVLPPALSPKFELRHDGLFQNYFSIGLDARITNGVGESRATRCGKCCFKTRCPCARRLHGGLLCYALHTPIPKPCCSGESLMRGKEPAVKVLYYKRNGGEEVSLNEIEHAQNYPVQQFTLTNLNSYGAGMKLFPPDKYEHRNGEMPSVLPSDQKLEVFTLRSDWDLIKMTTFNKFFTFLFRNCHKGKYHPDPFNLEEDKRRGIKRQSGDTVFKIDVNKSQFFQMDGEGWVLYFKSTLEVKWKRHVKMVLPPDKDPRAKGCRKRHVWGKGDNPSGIWGSGMEHRFWSHSSWNE